MSNHQQKRLSVFRPDSTKKAVDIMTGDSDCAVVIVCDLIETANRISNGWNPSSNLLTIMDEVGLYDDRIVTLYKDVCDGDIAKTHAVIRGYQYSKITREQLHQAIDMRCAGPDLKKAFEEIKMMFPFTQAELDRKHPECPYNGNYPDFKL